MEDDKNPIRGGVVDELNKSNVLGKLLDFITGNKEINCDEIINNFKNMLEDSSSGDKIRNDNELSKKVCEIYVIIKDKYINE